MATDTTSLRAAAAVQERLGRLALCRVLVATNTTAVLAPAAAAAVVEAVGSSSTTDQKAFVHPPWSMLLLGTLHDPTLNPI